MKQVGNFKYNQKDIEQLCKENGISYLALFGSYLHGDNSSDSDVDLLVKFTNISGIGLFKYVNIQNQFADTIGKKVDLVMTDSVDPYIKNQVLKEAQPIYINE